MVCNKNMEFSDLQYIFGSTQFNKQMRLRLFKELRQS